MKRSPVRGAVIAAAGIAACGFSPTLVGTDSKPVDAGPCQTLTAECTDDSTLHACSARGQPPHDTTCPWGCLGSSDAHCGALVPTGTGATPDDVVNSAGLLDVEIDDDINGDDGSIKSGERDAGVGINQGIDYKVINGYAVFRAKSWHITGDLVISGAQPVVFVAIGDVTIDQTFDARGKCNNGSPGPGGFAGGDLDAAGSGAGLTGGGDAAKGGGGGGHGTAGGDGGNNAATGGMAFGDLTLAILVGGGGGGGGGPVIVGGGGGGAVQVVAGGTITIGTSGNVDAGGCGGTHGGGGESGGGGGAGGAILLEALAITVSGVVAANGGGGGAGGGGNSGTKGGANRTPASGGMGGDGDGGPGAVGGTAAMPGEMASHSGGGGGGVGIIRLNTRMGSASVDNTTLLSPNFDDPQTTTTQGSAHVQ